MKENNVTVKGVGFFGLLGIAFIVLKLCGVVDWAWWVVLLPIWGPIVGWLVVMVVLFTYYFFRK